MFYIGLIISVILGCLLQVLRSGKHTKTSIILGMLIIVLCYCFAYFFCKYNHIQGITIL